MGDKSFTDSGKKYKPVGVNVVTSLSVGEFDLEFPLVSPVKGLPTKQVVCLLRYINTIIND